MPDDGEPIARVEDYRPKRRFQPVRFRNIRPPADPPYLVKGLIPREGLVVIWGPPKCGKTFWAFDLTMHVALGWPYRGHQVQQGTVVYVACEGERGLGARSEAFRLSRLSEDADPPFYLLTTRLDLVADANDLIGDIRAAIGADSCAMIVIDTLNSSIAGSESRDDDMSAYVKAADRLREAFRAAVIIIHHCGHNGERPRGHTSLTGAADCQIAVKRDPAGQVCATVEYMKDGPEGAVMVSRLVVVGIGTDADGEPITSCVIEAADSPIGPKSGKSKKLSPPEARALELLIDTTGRHGEVPTPNPYIPANTPCVSEAAWREACYRGSISGSDKPDAKRMAFDRAAKALVAARLAGKWDNWVWPVNS